MKFPTRVICSGVSHLDKSIFLVNNFSNLCHSAALIVYCPLPATKLKIVLICVDL